MKVPRQLDLAVKMVKSVNQEPKRVQDLAVSVGTTVSFLEQIARRLRIAGIVNAVRGPGGGYVATEGTVTLYDVAKALRYTDDEMSGLDGEFLLLIKGWIVRNGNET